MKALINKKKIIGLRRFLRPLLATLALCLVFNFISLYLMRKESVRSLDKTSDYLLDNINMQISNLIVSSRDLLYGSEAISVGRLKPGRQSYALEKAAIQLNCDLYSFCLSTPMAEDVILYYPKLGCVIDRKGIFSEKNFYTVENPELPFEDESFEAWFQTLFSRGQNGAFSSTDLEGNNNFYFFCSAPDNTRLEDCDRMILLKYSRSSVTDMMQRLSALMDQQYVAMISPNGTVFAEAGRRLEADSTQTIAQYTSAGYFVKKSHLNAWNMDIYCVQSTNQVETFFRLTAGIMLGGLGLALLLGLLLIILEQKKLVEKTKTILEKTGAGDGDIYSEITDRLNHFYEENLKYIRTIEQQRRVLSDSCLKDMLFSKNRSAGQIEAICAAYDMVPENNLFSAYCFVSRPLAQEENHQRIQSLLNYVENSGFGIYSAQLDECIVFICNYDDTDAGTQKLAEFWNALEALDGKVYGNGRKIHTLVGALNECRTLYRVSVGHSLLSGKYTSSELIQQIIVSLSEKRYRAVLTLLPVMEEQMRNNEKKGNMMLCLRHSFLSDLYLQPQFQADSSVCDQIYANLTSDEWLAPLYEYLREKIGLKENAVQPRNVVPQAEQIISTEFTNPDLGLNYLAERLNVTASYLSRAFKQAYGENISNYINKARILRAKEIILAGETNLGEVALQVGFLTDRNFIRVFKKLEDETPGAFRKRSKAEGTQEDNPEEPDA